MHSRCLCLILQKILAVSYTHLIVLLGVLFNKLSPVVLWAGKGKLFGCLLYTSRKVAKKVFEAIFDEDVDPEVYVEENGLKTVNDEGALRKVIEEIVANNPKSVEDYKAGKKKAMGFFSST